MNTVLRHRISWPAVLGVLWMAFASTTLPAATNKVPVILEAVGKVDLRRHNSTNWLAAVVKQHLNVGDQLRTGSESRAAVELSDRSIVRVGEKAVLVLQAPRGKEERRFRLESGKIFLFNRTKPSSVEFETPLASGAIRGTEFVLNAGLNGQSTDLELIDGQVDLTDSARTYQLSSGQAITVDGIRPAIVREISIARSLPPWAMRFPMVLVPEDLNWMNRESKQIAASLKHYEAGNPVAAISALPGELGRGEATQIYRSALLVAVGRTEMINEFSGWTAGNTSIAHAIQRLIKIVHDETPSRLFDPETATEWLVKSWERQYRRDPESALEAARNAAVLSPSSGLAAQRVAELAFGLDRFSESKRFMERASALSPKLAPTHMLQGYLLLRRSRLNTSLAAFDRAVELDPSLSGAWLGRGVALQRLGQKEAAEDSLMRAAALDPLVSSYRTALAENFAAKKDTDLAEKELRFARELNPDDPLVWLVSALQHWQQNRPNEAIRELETSLTLNDERAVFRPENLRARDRAVRSANLASIYREVGLEESALRLASRATTDAYTDFSGHLLLANYYRDFEDPNAFDLRYETTRFSEQLMSSLLAPAGAGNLSLVLDQQAHLRYLTPPRFGIGSITEYDSNGDWWQRASLFGNEGNSSYAFDVDYRSFNGQQPNGWLEQRWLSMQWKINLTLQDEIYFQAGWLERENGDVARYYDPSDSKTGFSAEESQRPTALLGYHRTWSPEHHTLVLGSYTDDQFDYFDPSPPVLFLEQSGGSITSVQTPGFFEEVFGSRFRLFSGEAQHIWSPGGHTVIGGARFQAGSADSEAILSRPLPPPVGDQSINEPFRRADVYLYDQWKLLDSLSLIGGLTYSYVEYPANADVAPLSEGTESQDILGPKIGAVWSPWKKGLLRAIYSRSIGGLYFDNSVRLEPTQLGGFNQTFRSLIPESVAGLVPGTEFNIVSVGFDQSINGSIFVGAGFDWLTSDGNRQVGVLTNSTILPIPDSPSQTQQSLQFEERSFSVYAGSLLGDQFSVSARYRLSDAGMESVFPQIPSTAIGLDQLNQDVSAILQHGQLNAQWQHPFGWFARWTSDWYHQVNAGYYDSLEGDDFWQHSVFAGYRLPGRQVQVQVGVLNLFDTDYRLNPLNYITVLPRNRSFVASLNLNF